MTKQVSPAASVKVAKKLGTEPVIILGVEWTDNAITYYADKDINDQIKGRILNKSEIDSVVNVSRNGEATVVNVVLDDSDGSLKVLLNKYDLHKRPAKLYQWYDGLAVSEKFVLFSGEVASPITWDEGDRKLSFSVTSVVEDKEVGFSPESRQFGFVSEELAGKPWPLVFGDCIHVPAAKVKETVTGKLREVVGLVDSTLQPKLDLLDVEEAKLLTVANRIAELQALANDMAPSAHTILSNYITAILNEDAIIHDILEIEDNITTLEKRKAALAGVNKRKADGVAGRIEAAHDDAEQKQDEHEQSVIDKQIFEYQTQMATYKHQALSELEQKAAEVTAKYQKLIDTRTKIKSIIAVQERLVKSQFYVEGGDKFPQGVLVDILIEDMRFRGTFTDKLFTVQTSGLPKYYGVAVDPAYDESRLDTFFLTDISKTLVGNYVLLGNGVITKVIEQNGTECRIQLRELSADEQPDTSTDNSAYSGYSQNQAWGPLNADTQAALSAAYAIDQKEYQTLKTLENLELAESQNNVIYQIPAPKSNYAVTTLDISSISEVARVPLPHWFSFGTGKNVRELPESTAWGADVGSTVYLADDQTEIFVANIVPSTIKAVHAFRNVDGLRKLQPVPSDYYTKVESQTLGDMTVTALTFRQPLTAYVGEQWEDGIYVTLNSSVSGNTADVLQYIVETYTSGAVDTTTFADLHDKLENYPSNFALLDRKNVLTCLSEIAWQARCSIWETNGVFYVRYLSEEPSVATGATISENDVLEKSLQLGFTRTEELVTKFVATWRSDYSDEKPNKLTLRHNIKKYGTHEKEYDFYIYSDKDLVEKSATFWMIRYCNTWKQATFQLPLTKIRLETQDAVRLDFASKYFSTLPVNGIVESAVYDAEARVIRVSVWLPVRAGEMEAYDYAWPSDLEVDVEFPTQNDIAGGAAGDGTNFEAVGTIGDYTIDMNFGIRPPDYGRRFMSDAYDTTRPSPTSGYEEVRFQFRGKEGVNTPNEGPIDPEVDVRPEFQTPTGTHSGRLRKRVTNKPDTWEVWLANGQIVEARIERIVPDDAIDDGDQWSRGKPVIVHLGDRAANGEPENIVRDPPEPLQLAEVAIVAVHDNYLLCENPDDPEEGVPIRVAKPYYLQKWLWEGETLDHLSYQGIDEEGNLRTVVGGLVSGAGYREILTPRYNYKVDGSDANRTIMAARMPYAVPCGDPDDADNRVTHWVDLNVEARAFRPSWRTMIIEGELDEDLLAGDSAVISIQHGPLCSQCNDDYADTYDIDDGTGGEKVRVDDALLDTGKKLLSGTRVVATLTNENRWLVIASKGCPS